MTRPFKSKRGATAIEYSLIAALIAMVIVTALGVMGEKTADPLNAIATALP